MYWPPTLMVPFSATMVRELSKFVSATAVENCRVPMPPFTKSKVTSPESSKAVLWACVKSANRAWMLSMSPKSQ